MIYQLKLLGGIFFAVAVFSLNMNHNLVVSNETHGRDLQYYSWHAITTQEPSFFHEVATGDFLVSLNQNDAYETNAGSFFWNTGKRLKYIFRTVSIWPDYSNCRIEDGCNLDRVIERAATVYPTLDRSWSIIGKDLTKKNADWVRKNMQKNAFASSTPWLFDIFPMTSNTMVAYLGKINGSSSTAEIELKTLKVATLSMAKDIEFNPSVAGLCLQRTGQVLSKNDFRKIYINFWGFLGDDEAKASKSGPLTSSIDIRSVELGTC